jgi:hypothetical protein
MEAHEMWLASWKWPNFEWMDVMVFWSERERERERDAGNYDKLKS